MLVIRKKRLFFILSTVIVSVLSVGIVHKMPSYKTYETVALPVSNRVVVLDARTRLAR